MGKMIFFDYDGTLISGAEGVSTPSAAVRKALGALRAAGHQVILATGRSLCFLEKDVLDMFCGSISQNGSHIEYGGRVLRDVVMPGESVAALRRDMEAHGVVYVLENSAFCRTKNTSDPYFQKIMRYFDLPVTCVQNTSSAPDAPCAKWMVFAKDNETLAWVARRWGSRFAIVAHHTMPCADGMLPGISKGEAIAMLLKHARVAREDSMAFGDSRNDLEMLQTVGTGIAMGVHDAALEQTAAFITDCVAADGVKTGLERLGLV